MAIGFSPKHIQEYPLLALNHQQFLILSTLAAKALDWDLGPISENGFIAYTKFSMSSWSEEITIRIENGIATLKSECTGSQIIDWGKNRRNIESLVEKIEGLKQTISIEDLATKFEALRPELASGDQDLTGKPPATKDKITSFFSIFIPTKGFFITPIMINLNIFVFTLMIIAGVNIILPDNESLLSWGANFRPLTLAGEWWRLLTCCFLHIGIFHLLMNMYALLYIGLLLEPYLGRVRFLTAYLLTGVAASVTSLWWHDLTISAGASGAIFGMYGVFLALLSTNFIEKAARKALLTSIGLFVGYNLLNGMKGGIDNAAHIGGLVGGLLIGYAFIPGLKKPSETKLNSWVIGSLTLLILGCSATIYLILPNDIALYDSKMKDFSANERMALEVYNLPENAPKEKLLYGLKDGGLYYWKENIKLFESCEDLDLPTAIVEKNKLLKEYCTLRLKSYELLYKAISEDSDKYKADIEDYNHQIELIIKVLSSMQKKE